MPVYKLERIQLINAPIEKVWHFFSNPLNLETITPAYMNFIVTSGMMPGEIFAGQMITYKVSPILGIPLNWETEITDVVPLKHFTDKQSKGPYKLWKHTHVFEEKQGKTLMTDVVEYQMPMGALGTLAHGLWVKGQLNRIFNFRFQKVEELFNNGN